MGVEERELLMPVYDIAGVVDIENDRRGLPFIGGHPLIDDAHVSRIASFSEGAFSNRDGVGCEHRFAPVSGSRPQASLKAGSARKASRSSASSYPQAIAKMRARTMSASVCVIRSGSRRSGKHRANLSAIPNRRSAIASSMTPPSEVSRPPSKAAATGLRPTAGNENGSRLELVMASGCWGARRNGSV